MVIHLHQYTISTLVQPPLSTLQFLIFPPGCQSAKQRSNYFFQLSFSSLWEFEFWLVSPSIPRAGSKQHWLKQPLLFKYTLDRSHHPVLNSETQQETEQDLYSINFWLNTRETNLFISISHKYWNIWWSKKIDKKAKREINCTR